MSKLIIPQSMTIKRALEILDESPTKTLFLTDSNGVLTGSLTDGDIRRWILKTGDIKGVVTNACNPEPFVLRQPIDKELTLSVMSEKHLQAAPVINETGIIESIVIRDELEGAEKETKKELAGVPVVIMAGGKGTRMDPFTRILPKPLIPIGNQPVIEIIMQEYAKYGANSFQISLNHQARLIKAYFEDQQYPYEIGFIEEDKPLGTAGALRLLKGVFNSDLFVSNCDSIIRSDYNEILKFHRQGGFALTITAALHNHAIPYGVCEVHDNGHLKSITEKPEYSILVNTGMYVLRSEITEMIPENEHYHITDLIADLKRAGKPVGVFPVNENSYFDLGQWDAYRSAVQHLTIKG